MGATAEQAWNKRWRHEGLYVRTVTAETLGKPVSTWPIVRARDSLGQEVTKPVLLTLGGLQETNPDAAIWRYTKIYGSLPYSALGLT